MDTPKKRDIELTKPLIKIFVGHYFSNFGVHPSKQQTDRVIKSIIKKKQEEFIETTFSGQNWKPIDLYDVSELVSERVIELKEIDATPSKD